MYDMVNLAMTRTRQIYAWFKEFIPMLNEHFAEAFAEMWLL